MSIVGTRPPLPSEWKRDRLLFHCMFICGGVGGV